MLSGLWEGEAPAEPRARLGRSLALPGRSDSISGLVNQKKTRTKLPDSLKAAVEAKAAALIENVMKPKYIQPPAKVERFNDIVDMGARWYRNSWPQGAS